MLKDKTFTLTQYAKEFKETHLQLKEAILKWVVQEHLGQWEENTEDIIPIKWLLIRQIEYNKEKLDQMSKLRPVNGNVIIRPMKCFSGQSPHREEMGLTVILRFKVN